MYTHERKIYRKRGNEIFVLPEEWEFLKRCAALTERWKITWTKIQHTLTPDPVLQQFGLA